MKKPPPIRSWSEPVDDGMIVGVARCFVTRAGGVYGLAAFVLCGPPSESTWQAQRAARAAAERRLIELVRDEHDGRLPYIGRIRDVAGDGVDMTW